MELCAEGMPLAEYWNIEISIIEIYLYFGACNLVFFLLALIS